MAMMVDMGVDLSLDYGCYNLRDLRSLGTDRLCTPLRRWQDSARFPVHLTQPPFAFRSRRGDASRW